MKKPSKKTNIRDYYELTKPGIIRGNLITAAAGFLLGSYGDVDWFLLLAALAGTTLVIASACVFNNYLDRGIDAKMKRTKQRGLVTGRISVKSAIDYGVILGGLGFLLLGLLTNNLVLLLGVIAWVFYVVVYGYAKRRSVHGTVVGSIPGALPITAGYVAATNQLDSGALLLFLILVCWQMPHFYSIAIYRMREYKAAGLPLLPIVRGVRHTKFQIMIYIVLFIAVTTLLTALGYTGKTYLIVMALTGFLWLWQALQGFYTDNDEKWARSMFGCSLLVLLIFSLMISDDSFLL